ncbi:MAG TPA: [FeFe] hydrogenase H-cluster maturation GTPase HydF [Candidatus Dorea intestinavium]|nr:[FeFe] hydrogenase H-cluster maturation GTPase HydF [Candidatus Dorea intestinavium]
MSLTNVPTAQRVHIGLFGKRNAGKSSIINALTNQEVAIVSNRKGTTTDPVLKTMELNPLGPVIFMDTAGLDDISELGPQRIKKTYQILNKTDIALLVVEAKEGLTKENLEILEKIKKKEIPYLIIYNKSDQVATRDLSVFQDGILVSAKYKGNIESLKEKIASLLPSEGEAKPLAKDLIKEQDFVVLVVPIDKSAPKGRLILPQQQTIRDLLDKNVVPIIANEHTLEGILTALVKPPALVITDSQIFKKVAKIVPATLPLTSFSILFARYKGLLEQLVEGAKMLDHLPLNPHILIAEGCTHHRQCEDIGSVKLPQWLEDYTNREPSYTFTSGAEFPEDLRDFDLIIHCGSCMLNEREMKYRLHCAKDEHIPMTNYGMAIAYMHGILERAMAPLLK